VKDLNKQHLLQGQSSIHSKIYVAPLQLNYSEAIIVCL